MIIIIIIHNRPNLASLAGQQKDMELESPTSWLFFDTHKFQYPGIPGGRLGRKRVNELITQSSCQDQPGPVPQTMWTQIPFATWLRSWQFGYVCQASFVSGAGITGAYF